MTPEQALKLIEETSNPAAIFPGRVTAGAVYKVMLTLVHPDRFPADQRPRAAEAAGKLAKLYSQINGKTASPAVIGPFVVESPLAKGDLADLYLVTSESKGDGVLKIARSAGDNDLMDSESRALQALWKAKPDTFHKYLPRLLDTFTASGRRVNVLSRHPGYLPLSRICELYPSGVPFAHVVWMMNRLLSALAFIADCGYVHGGITPDHLLYHPDSHGLVIVGWCSAVPAGQPVPIAASTWKERRLYPEEVLRKRPATATADIFMAAESMRCAAPHIPRRFAGLFTWCTAGSPGARPQNAIELQDLWIRLAEQEYGKPKYLKLDLPVQ